MVPVWRRLNQRELRDQGPLIPDVAGKPFSVRFTVFGWGVGVAGLGDGNAISHRHSRHLPRIAPRGDVRRVHWRGLIRPFKNLSDGGREVAEIEDIIDSAGSQIVREYPTWSGPTT
jgi:hypothetical protein